MNYLFNKWLNKLYKDLIKLDNFQNKNIKFNFKNIKKIYKQDQENLIYNWHILNKRLSNIEFKFNKLKYSMI
jgi:hypothetical protein